MKLRYLTLCALTMMVQACATKHPEPQEPVVTMDAPPLVEEVRRVELDRAQIFSNDSVIYYPLDKPAGAVKQSFPKYRSVLDNTTAGGYTVFDESVTVYALNGADNKPEYLPTYSVPQYAAQYESDMMRMQAEERAQVATVKPAPPVRLTGYEDSLHREPITAAPLETAVPRRSPRLLTAYE